MALQPGDLKLTLIPSDIKNNRISCVVGRESTFKLILKNQSTTDPIYNLNLTLTLPDGISFVSSSITSSTNTIDSSFKNIVTYINMIDLYPYQKDFELSITFKINETFRATGLPISYNSILSGLLIQVKGDSKPRGNYDAGNSQVSTSITSSATSQRFSAKIIAPTTYIKGAGKSTGNIIDATSIFNVSIELSNSTRNSSNIYLNISLPNGFRYIGVWNSSGTDATNFENPLVTLVSPTQDYVKFTLNNKTLSAGSTTILTFQVAIWNKYTENGIENSGSIISNESILTTSLLMTGNTLSYETEFDISALDINILQVSESLVTDVDVSNLYMLTYEVSEYIDLTETILTYTIPDGMSYNSNSSTLTPTSISSNLGITELSWTLGNVNSSTTDTINLYTTTLSHYFNEDLVYSTDEFTTRFEINCVNSSTNTNINKYVDITLTNMPPMISTNVEGYYYNDLSYKSFNVAAVGDYIRFNMIYDARHVAAPQKDVYAFDYPPLNMSVNDIIDIVITGNYPSSITTDIMPDNGIRMALGTISSGAYFEIQGSFLVSSELDESLKYNLVKCILSNTIGEVTSLRDSSLVYFGIPHMKINQTVSTTKCLSLNDTMNYEINIYSFTDPDANYIVDAFNISLIADIPSLFTPTSVPSISGTADYNTLNFTNNHLTLNISKLPPDGNLTILIPIEINTLPIMGKSYSLTTSMTNGTSQSDPNSYHYNNNEYPLDNTLSLKGCTPTITKTYTPSTVKLDEYYKATVNITFPAGGLAYNTKIKDSLISTNSSNLKNVKLNNETPYYNVITNNMTIPILETLDTSTGSISYTLEYEDKVLTATPINYSDIRTTTASIDWSEVISSPETLLKQAQASLTIVVPGIIPTKYQNNESINNTYYNSSLSCTINDIINYKINLFNEGLSPGYSVFFSDVIPTNLTYISNDSNGTYDSSTKTFTLLFDSIDINESKNIIIKTFVNNTVPGIVASNESTVSFKANSTLPNIYDSNISNSLTLYNDSILVIKSQKNITAGDENYTTATIRCFKNQTIKYKVTVSNPLPTLIENITITDTYPNNLTFISFDSFTSGTLSRTNNTITASINTLNSNASLEFSYTLQLNNATLERASSISTMVYSFPNSQNVNTEFSNRLYTILAGLGRGFKIY